MEAFQCSKCSKLCLVPDGGEPEEEVACCSSDSVAVEYRNRYSDYAEQFCLKHFVELPESDRWHDPFWWEQK